MESSGKTAGRVGEKKKATQRRTEVLQLTVSTKLPGPERSLCNKGDGGLPQWGGVLTLTLFRIASVQIKSRLTFSQCYYHL